MNSWEDIGHLVDPSVDQIEQSPISGGACHVVNSLNTDPVTATLHNGGVPAERVQARPPNPGGTKRQE